MRYLALALTLSAPVWADYTYTQTSQMTGGTMVQMMRNLGSLAGNVREPIVATNIIKGNRMAVVTKDHTTIYDLDKDTITTIEPAKKQYSVVTFAEMSQAVEKTLAKAQGRNNAQVNMKVSAKATGETKNINGMTAKELVMMIEPEGAADPKNPTSGMKTKIDTWVAEVPGFEEAKAFEVKLGQKLGRAFGSAMQQQIAAMQPGASQSMAQASQEMAKVQGVPVQSIMMMGGDVTADTAPAPATQQQQQSQQPQQSAGAAAAGAALGRLGGIGGFGRTRTKDKQADAPPPQAANPPAAGSTTLMEMTTELTSFASGAADASKFEIPAGFKQVENEIVKRSR